MTGAVFAAVFTTAALAAMCPKGKYDPQPLSNLVSVSTFDQKHGDKAISSVAPASDAHSQRNCKLCPMGYHQEHEGW